MGRAHPCGIDAFRGDTVDDPGDCVLLDLNGLSSRGSEDRRIGRILSGLSLSRRPADKHVSLIFGHSMVRDLAGLAGGGLQTSHDVPGDRIDVRTAAALIPFPQGILGDDLRKLVCFDLLQLFPVLFLLRGDLFRHELVRHSAEVQTGGVFDLFPQVGILKDLLQDIAADLFHGADAQEPGVRPFSFRISLINLEFPDLARLHDQRPGCAGERVGHPAHHLAFQDAHQADALLHLSDPACGAPHAGDHGGGADIQLFVLLQRRGDIEEQLAALQQQLQGLPAATDLQAAGLVQLHRLFGVQGDPGVAGLLRGDHIAVIQAHILPGAVGLAAGAGDGHRPLRLEQTDLGAGGVLRQSRDRQPQAEAQAQQPDEAPSQGTAQRHRSVPLSCLWSLLFHDTLA